MLAGSYAIADIDFEKRAQELLGQDDQYDAALQKFTNYLNHLTSVIPVWGDIAKLPPGSLEISQIPVKREEGWICLTATGLNIIGRVGHRLFTNAEIERDWQTYASKLGDPQIINWRRDAEIWQGTIIQGNKLLTQQMPVRRAFQKVAQAIGIENALAAGHP